MENPYHILRVTEKTLKIDSNFKSDFKNKILTGLVQAGYFTKCYLIYKTVKNVVHLTITTELKLVDNNQKAYISGEFATEFSLLDNSLVESGVSDDSIGFMGQLYLIAQANAQGILLSRLEKLNLPVIPTQTVPFGVFHGTVVEFLQAHRKE